MRGGKRGFDFAATPNALWTNEHVTTLIVFGFDLRQNFLRVRPDHHLPEKASALSGQGIKIPTDSACGREPSERDRGTLMSAGGCFGNTPFFFLSRDAKTVHPRLESDPIGCCEGSIPIVTTHMKRLGLISAGYIGRGTVAKARLCF